MILPPAIANAVALMPAPLPVHDAEALLTYQSPQLERHARRVAISAALAAGLDLDGATDPQELS